MDRQLRVAAIAALGIGAGGSLALMAWMGQRQQSLLVIALFVIWDAAPFALLGLAEWLSSTWDRRKQVALHAVSIAVSLASLSSYLLDTLGPPHPQAAFMFVIVPPVLIVAAAVALLTAHRLYNVK